MKKYKWLLSLLTLSTLSISIFTMVSCNNTKNINSETILNKKYNCQIHGVDEYTNRAYTNDYVKFDDILLIAQNEMDNNISQTKINEYFNIFVQNYISNFVNQSTNQIHGSIIEQNIQLNQDKSISGNISIKFEFLEDNAVTLKAGERKQGDVEIHNFVFENNKMESYINHTISNFVSFKISLKYLQKQLIVNDNSNRSFNIVLPNEIIYFDNINELTLQLNNSLMNININNYINNMYLYSISNDIEKEIIKIVLKSILSNNARLIITGISPITNKIISAPLLEIDISSIYNNQESKLNINTSFLMHLQWEIASLFNFVSSLDSAKIINNSLYISTNSVMSYSNDFIDFDININSDLNGTYREYKSLNFFIEDRNIKQQLINNISLNFDNSWNEYITNLSDNQKAELIYDWLLPYISYGQKDIRFPNKIGGYTEQKLICEGYTHMFQYISNILEIKSIGVTGIVKTGASPGQTDTMGKHAWNLININGSWLWCDSTWDDSLLASSPAYNKEYFLKNTNQFFTQETHHNIENWDSGKLLPIQV